MRSKFLKDNWSNIVKLYINQIGVAIFAMFLYTAASAISDDANLSLIVKVVISVFSTLFYFVLIYNVSWEIGAKDKIKVDAGRLEKKSSKGIGIGIITNTPNFIVVGLALILYIIFVLSGVELFESIFAVLNLLFRLFISMYLGMIQGISTALSNNENLSWILQTFLYLVFSAISAIIIHISYVFGLNDKRIFPNSKYKSNK